MYLESSDKMDWMGTELVSIRDIDIPSDMWDDWTPNETTLLSVVDDLTTEMKRLNNKLFEMGIILHGNETHIIKMQHLHNKLYE